MKRLKKIIVIFMALLLLIILAAYIYLKQTLPKIEGVIHVAGSQGEILIKRNRWGVPSIEASSIRDMFFALGFVQAQDRLFQMDLARRLAAGRLSEIFGERALELDMYYKNLLIEESMEKSLLMVNPDRAKIIQSYCQGINACIKTQPLPPEFILFGYRPEVWTIRDMFATFKTMEILLADSGSELYNLKLVQALGRSKAEKFIYGEWGSTIISREEYEEHRSGKGVTAGVVDREYKELFKNPSLEIAFFYEERQREGCVGSNNWVISGQRTAAGAPILANDPHLASVFPSYFYQVIARTGDIELSGNTIPGVPFIVLGRNQHIGWGFTNLGTDVTDYFILKINPGNRNQYQWQGEWRDFEIIEKKIKIKGKGDYIHQVKVCQLGPVLEEDGTYFAQHSIVRYPSTVFDAFFEMNFASSLEEFIEGLKKFSSPAQNVVFADRAGNIGYYPSGLIPKRQRGNGELPLPASSSADAWDGFYPEEEKPYLLNPGKGYIVTANNPVLPQVGRSIFAESWSPFFRAERIDELIAAKTRISLAENQAVQTDTLLKNAEFLVNKIEDFEFTSNEANFVLKHLKSWDFRADSGISPYLFYRFERHLTQDIFSDHIKEERLRRLISSAWLYKIMDYPGKNIENKDFTSWVDDVSTPQKEDFQEIVKKGLTAAYHDFISRSKKENLDWQKLHTLTYQPRPLGSVFLFKTLLNRGPYPMKGGKGCILAADFKGSDFKVNHISTFRMILDFSDFSNSLLINSTGQSGHFLSPHYDDQIPLYINLQYRAMEDFSSKPKILRLLPHKNKK